MIRLKQNLKTYRKKPPTPHEDLLQEWCVVWFRNTYPGKIIASVPNGARTSISVAVRLKKTGLLKGFPDLVIPHPAGQYHGLFIEMKVKGNYPSKEQKQILEHLKQQGYKTAVCYSLEEFQQTVQEYLALETRVGV